MRKKLTLILTILLLAVSMSMGVLFTSAQDVKATASADLNWTLRGGAGNATVQDGYTFISGVNGWEHRMSYDYKVKLDGLKLDITMKDFPADGLMGIVFSKVETGYFSYDNTFAMKLHRSPYGAATDPFARLYFGKNHDHGGGINYAQMSKESDATGFNVDGGATKELCFYNKDAFDYTYSVKFEKDGESFYKVTVSCVKMYNGMGGKVGNDIVFYIKTSNIANALDTNGDLYIVVGGGFNLTADSTTLLKITDANQTTYDTVTKAAINAKIGKYATDLAAVTDANTANIAIISRNEAIAEITNKAHKNDVAALKALVSAEDAKVTNDQFFKKAATDVLDEATTAINAFSDDTSVTAENITVAKAKVTAAENKYTEVCGLLKAATKTELDGIFATNLIKLNKAEVVKWIITYESKIAALDTSASTIGSDIAAVKTFKNTFGASSEKVLLDALPQADKDALNARIAVADAKLVASELEAADKVKESYLAVFETAVAGDLTVETNIRVALAAKKSLEENVIITDADAALYTRFTAATTTLITSIDKYLTVEILAVKDAAGKEYATFDEYKTLVKERYEKIDLKLLDANSSKKAEIEASYETVKTTISANFWSEFNGTELITFERNKDGIKFDMTPKFPAHINYNKKLNVETGIDIKLNFDKISYFNGDKDTEGNPLGANNLCINFLSEADKYKSTGTGFNIIIWLFEVESNITIVDSKDAVVQSMSLATPLIGGELNIKFNYKDYYDLVNDATYKAYIIEINGNEMVLKPEILESKGITLPKNDCYFSLGSFADKPTFGNNGFTLTEVNGVKFAKIEAGGDGTDTGEGDNKEEVKPKGCGCSASSVASLFAILPILFGVSLIIAKRH